MTTSTATLTRRQLLSRSAAAGAAFVVGSGYVASNSAAWAMEVQHLQPTTMATLIQMARDIYPHDHVADEFYAVAVKGYDSEENAEKVEAGIAALNAAAEGAGHASYIDTGWERDRVDILRGMEDGAFFQSPKTGGCFACSGYANRGAFDPLDIFGRKRGDPGHPTQKIQSRAFGCQ